MAEEKDKKPFVPPPLPSLPKLPPLSLPPLPGMGPAGPAKSPTVPGLPTLPSLKPVSVIPPPFPPAPASGMLGGTGRADAQARDLRPAPPPNDMSRDMDRKVAELEKKLQEEREKVLLANLRSQEEANYASKVEMAIKDVQDKLRRDRREAEMEEGRLKLETKIQELEQRLVSERETWVSTLKGQVQTREVQDKEIETHFAVRMQEMERRWMEEKAHWQKTLITKEEEIRNLRSLAEKLKGADVELHKISEEKKLLEERIAHLTQDSAELRAKARTFEDRERDFFQAKAELMTAKEQVRLHQERFEHEIQMIRMTAKEREDRLLSDNEHLQRDIEATAERVRREMDLEIKKYQAQTNAAKSEGETAAAALTRLKAVSGTLERQVASLKVQAVEALKAKGDLEKHLERYKAEFLVIQKRWQDREREIRQEMEESAQQRLEAQAREFQKTLEAEKARIQLESMERAQYRRPLPPEPPQ